MGLKQIIANKTKSCAVAPPSTRNAQLLDDLDQNTRNLLRNISATTSLKPLENKDYIRNLPRNHDATVQKTDAQLSPLKTHQKLRDKNTKLRGDLPTLSGVVGGDNSVNSANSLSDESANDDYETFVVKPVIQELVQQVDEVSTTGETLKLEKEDNGLDLSRYAHLITCQQCEHLSLTGTCTLKGTQMYPDAKRACTSFNALKTERIHIENTPYSHSQMQGFLTKYEKPLFDHLVDCVDCDFEAARYCHAIFKVGNGYDIMLSYFDDGLARREALLAQVVKARISGRKLFVASEGNVSPPC